MCLKSFIISSMLGLFAHGFAYAEPALPQKKPQNLLKLGLGHIAQNTSSTDLAGPFTPSGLRVDIEDTQSVLGSYTRFFGDHFGIEALIGLPQKFEIKGIDNAASLGKTADVSSIAPTVLLNYYFTDRSARWRPYIGLAANHTHYYDEKATTSLETALQGETDISLSTSTDIGAFAGVNYQVNNRYYASLLVGYVNVSTKGTLTTISAPTLPPVERTISIDVNPAVAIASVGVSF